MKSLREYDSAALEVQESIPISVGKDKVKIWVEGNDWRLYSRFFVRDMVNQEGRKGGHSCHSAVDSYKEFKKLFPRKPAIVIRDADFKRANGEDIESEADIFYADCHDHEMMCVFQDKVRNAMMSNFEHDIQTEAFFDMIFDELRLLSYLKWYNYNEGCGYNFSTLGDMFGMNETEFKDVAAIEHDVYNRTLSMHRKKNITLTLNHIDIKDFSSFMTSRSDVDKFELTNGHDLYNRINFHLQKMSKRNTRSEEQLKDSVYTAFGFVFTNTSLYKRLDSWCRTNKRDILIRD